MAIEVDFWHLVGLLLGFIGSLCSFAMVLVRQIDTRIDRQNERISRVEGLWQEMQARLPVEYQRREDAIRFETVLNAKLDSIGARIERLMEKAY